MTCPRCEDGPLDVGAVAAIMGVAPATVRQQRWRQICPPEDGMVAGHPYWWRETIEAWRSTWDARPPRPGRAVSRARTGRRTSGGGDGG